jgi:hypothetical protein
MILYSSSTNNNSLWRDILKLKLLHSISIQILIVRWITKNWHTQSLSTKDSPHNSVCKRTPLFGTLFELMRIRKFLESYSCRVEVSRLQRTINHHVKDINSIMSQTRGLIPHRFSIEIHFQIASRHLDHSIIDSLISISKRLIVTCLYRMNGSRSLWSLISSSNIDQ